MVAHCRLLQEPGYGSAADQREIRYPLDLRAESCRNGTERKQQRRERGGLQTEEEVSVVG